MKLWFEKGAWASSKAAKKVETLIPEMIQSIAIIRHAAIGDMVILRPFITETRKFFPNAKITLSLTDSYSYGAPTDMVDRVHTVYKRKSGKKTSLMDRYRQFKELGEHDLIFDMADTSISGWLCLLNSAKLKIGFPYRQIKNRFLYDVSLLRSDLVPEIDTLLHMLNILGARTEYPYDFSYPAYSLNDEKPYIIYFTSASVANKCWPKEKFISLVGKMAECYPDVSHILLEGIKAEEKVDDMLDALSEFTNVKKSEALPLEEVMRFLGESQLVLCNDTGVRNMAISAGAATVGIFFSTIPFRYWPKDGLHEVVFNADGSIPSVESVFTSVDKHLDSLGRGHA